MKKEFGDKSNFSIIVEITESLNGIDFGKVSIFIKNLCFDKDVLAPIGPFYNHILSFLEKQDNTKVLDCHSECTELFTAVKSNYFGDPEPSMSFEELARYDRLYGAYVFSPGGGEFFDNVHIYIIQNDDLCRIVWKRHQNSIDCCLLEWQLIVRTLDSFVSWYQSFGRVL